MALLLFLPEEEGSSGVGLGKSKSVIGAAPAAPVVPHRGLYQFSTSAVVTDAV